MELLLLLMLLQDELRGTEGHGTGGLVAVLLLLRGRES
jgi:hypothetical protein